MADSTVAARVEPLVAPIAESQGIELYDVEYVKEGPDWILRLYIDKNGGVDLNDCERFSHAAEAALDAHDPIPAAYLLEVSSPGIERKLSKDAHFIKFSGEQVSVRLFRAVDGAKKYQGRLVGIEDGNVVIVDEKNTERRFERAQVSSCRLAVF